MKRKALFSILSIVAALALAGAIVLAPQTVYAGKGGGTGTLTASGDGLAGLRGNGSVTLSGNGVLYIRDLAGDASIQVEGNGIRKELSSGWIRYSGFQGIASVSGSQISVALSGFGIDMQASGTGAYTLRGDGTYSVEKDGQVVTYGAWTESGDAVQLP